MDESLDGELLSELELIRSQPLAQQAEGFDNLYDRLLTVLKSSDLAHD